MQIQDISLSALKGGRHTLREAVQLEPSGAAGDRKFAVVDLGAGRVLRTVEHPLLVSSTSLLENDVLSIEIDGRTVTGIPAPVGDILTLEYWDREMTMQVVEGPWASPFCQLLGRNVALAQISEPGGVVYGGAITLVTTSSLTALQEQAGISLDARRFRATFTVNTPAAPAYIEDTWNGRELSLGGARLVVGEGIPRCAVIDSDPNTGERGSTLLKTLARSRLSGQDIMFGVYARVTQPGLVRRGDAVTVLA